MNENSELISKLTMVELLLNVGGIEKLREHYQDTMMGILSKASKTVKYSTNLVYEEYKEYKVFTMEKIYNI